MISKRGDSGPDREFLRDTYERAGLKRPGVLWHALRHTYASILAAGGIGEDVVAVLMGHRGRSVTSQYTHLFEDAFEGAEEALHLVLGVNDASTGGSVTEDHSPAAADAQSERVPHS